MYFILCSTNGLTAALFVEILPHFFTSLCFSIHFKINCYILKGFFVSCLKRQKKKKGLFLLYNPKGSKHDFLQKFHLRDFLLRELQVPGL